MIIRAHGEAYVVAPGKFGDPDHKTAWVRVCVWNDKYDQITHERRKQGDSLFINLYSTKPYMSKTIANVSKGDIVVFGGYLRLGVDVHEGRSVFIELAEAAVIKRPPNGRRDNKPSGSDLPPLPEDMEQFGNRRPFDGEETEASEADEGA